MVYGSLDLFFLPILIIISLILMWIYLGKAVITGCIIIMLYVPLNSVLMTKFGDLQVINLPDTILHLILNYSRC